MINSNQILHGDQTRCEENFYTVLTRDLFTVANLVEFLAVFLYTVRLCVFKLYSLFLCIGLLVYEFYIKWINKYGKQFSFSKKLIFYRQVCSRF